MPLDISAQNRLDTSPNGSRRPFACVRTAVFLALALLLAGCGDTPYDQAIDIARGAIFGPEDSVDYAAVERIPYAVMAAKLEGQPRSAVVLSRVEGTRLFWVSPDTKGIVTRDGRIVETVGLAIDMRVSRFADQDPLAADWSARTQGSWEHMVDLPALGYYDVPVKCGLKSTGFETIDVTPGRKERARHILESCRAPSIDWAFANQYWLTEDGFPLKSIQHLAPTLPTMELIVLKQYRPS